MNKEKIVVDDKDKTLTPSKLFYNWFAANIGIMGFVYGAIIVSYHMSFIQALIAALVGALSFLIPGWVAYIGRKNGITTFKMSRAAYGTHGNKIPNGIAWFNMVGWLAVNITTITLLLSSMFGTIGISKNKLTLVIALAIAGSLVLVTGLLKEATLAKIQTWLSYIFGILTFIILLMFLAKTDWHLAFHMKTGSLVGGWLPAVAYVAAGSGISWSMAAADWGAYVKTSTKSSKTFWNTTMGGAIPLFILMVGGILLATIKPNLATASEPFAVMYSAVPAWFGFLYFLVAAGGLIPQCLVSFRSARINLETLGIHVSQLTSLVIHGVIVFCIPIYVLFISGDFLSNFEIFLNILGTCLASWVAIFLCDNVMYRSHGYDIKLLVSDSAVTYNWKGITAWIIATVVGFLFTNNAIWTGPFAQGIFYNTNLGVFISGIIAIFLMIILKPFKSHTKED